MKERIHAHETMPGQPRKDLVFAFTKAPLISWVQNFSNYVYYGRLLSTNSTVKQRFIKYQTSICYSRGSAGPSHAEDNE